jgi:hypothetical protein
LRNGKQSTLPSTKLAWSPQAGPQTALVKCPADEIFYGGARGGGKTDGMLGKFAVKASRYGEHCVGVFFRRSREDLKEAIERSTVTLMRTTTKATTIPMCSLRS